MFTRNIYFIGGILAALFLFGAFMYGAGNKGCEARKLKEDVKQINNNKEVRHAVITLPDPELDERLDRWMRD